jgi:hypothetical protein
MAESSKVPGSPTESEYLAQQAQAAQAAMSQAWNELKTKLGQGVDPKAWAKQHPWIAIGGAAVAGFAATAALVPSKEQQALRKLAELERALHPPAPSAVNGDAKKEKPSMLAAIALEAFAVLRPVLTTILTNQMGQTAADPQAEGNGHAPSDPPVPTP